MRDESYSLPKGILFKMVGVGSLHVYLYVSSWTSSSIRFPNSSCSYVVTYVCGEIFKTLKGKMECILATEAILLPVNSIVHILTPFFLLHFQSLHSFNFFSSGVCVQVSKHFVQ